MKLSRFAKLSVLVVLLASAAIGVNGKCGKFGTLSGATLDTNGATSLTAATVTCTNGYLYNSVEYLGHSKTFTCPTTGTLVVDGWSPKKTGLQCVTGKLPETPWAGHFAADMAIGLVIGALLAG
eukprot:679211_1